MSPMMTTHDVLVKARDLIADPARWTQEWYAKDAKGREIDQGDDEDFPSGTACQWCAVGALLEVRGEWDDLVKAGVAVLERCARDTHAIGITRLNDTTDHPTVLRTFDCAIATTEEVA